MRHAPAGEKPEIQSAQMSERHFSRLLELYTAAWSFEGAPIWREIEALYAQDPDIIFYDAFLPAPLIGRDAMIAHSKSLFGDLARLTVSTVGRCEVRRLGEHFATVASELVFAAEMRDGKSTHIPMRLTLVWERRDGRWLIVHEHVSAASPH